MRRLGLFAVAGALCVCALPTEAEAASVVKVDFDMSGRNSSEVSEPNYVPWAVSGLQVKIRP